MKATGEVMSIGRTMEESLLKAMRSLETGVCHIYHKKFEDWTNDRLLEYIALHVAVLRRHQLHILRADITFRGGLDISDLKAHALQSRHAVHDGVVLKGAGNQVLLVLAGLGEGSALHGPVVGLRAAAGEEDLRRRRVDGLCHLGAAGVHKLFGLIANAVMAAGVAAGTAQGLGHHCQHLRGTGSRGGIVEINHFLHSFHGIDPFWQTTNRFCISGPNVRAYDTF